MQSVKDLCGKIRENGAVPVLYATWAYQKDGKQLQKFGIDYDEMYRKMHEAYAEAAEKNHTLLAAPPEPSFAMSQAFSSARYST